MSKLGNAKRILHKKPIYWLLIVLVISILFASERWGVSYYLAWNYENKILSEVPVFKLLALRSPLEFNNYIKEIRMSLLADHGDRAPFYTGEYIYSQLKKYSPHGSNQDFYSLAQATIDFYNQIYIHDPSLVLNLEFNLPSSEEELKIEKIYTSDVSLLNPITKAKENIIESSIKNPQPLLSESDKIKAQGIINSIMINLSLDYGNAAVYNTFNHPDDPALDKKTGAEIIIQFYQMLLNHGTEDAGLTIKYLYSSARDNTTADKTPISSNPN